jgi:hypothetical protein
MKEMLNNKLLIIINSIEVKIRSLTISAYLYGSVIRSFKENKDIYIIIIAKIQNHEKIFKRLSIIQSKCKYAIHPIVVQDIDINKNPLFSMLIEAKNRIW